MKTLQEFFALGADGVQLGTRFVASFECAADDAFKRAHLNLKEEDIVIIESPVGMPEGQFAIDLPTVCKELSLGKDLTVVAA